jgi:hypothetical protein
MDNSWYQTVAPQLLDGLAGYFTLCEFNRLRFT